MGRYASYRDALCYISGRLLVVVDELRAGGRGGAWARSPLTAYCHPAVIFIADCLGLR